MRLLHTSDWHIGRSLYGRKRYDEFQAFLDWLAEVIQKQQVDALLVAGDIFDTTTPSNRAQELYYRFLNCIATSACRHVIITGGNHDSPSFLNAPRELLKALDVHIIGATTGDVADEVLVLRNQQGQPEAIVCAVPYLRERDMRLSEAGESSSDKERKLQDGIRNHYREAVTLAEQQRSELALSLPIIAMGHLFTAGGKTIDGDGVRDLSVGSLSCVRADIFPESIEYVALGHLHVPQIVNSKESIRYSGSPIPMGFGEARQQKSVVLVELNPAPTIQLLNVPVFQQLEQIKGDWPTISTRIAHLAASHSRAWLEVTYRAEEVLGGLREQLEELITTTNLEILRIKNEQMVDRVLESLHDDESLHELDVHEVFQRCLSAHEVPSQQQPELLRVYEEALQDILYADIRAE